MLSFNFRCDESLIESLLEQRASNNFNGVNFCYYCYKLGPLPPFGYMKSGEECMLTVEVDITDADDQMNLNHFDEIKKALVGSNIHFRPVLNPADGIVLEYKGQLIKPNNQSYWYVGDYFIWLKEFIRIYDVSSTRLLETNLDNLYNYLKVNNLKDEHIDLVFGKLGYIATDAYRKKFNKETRQCYWPSIELDVIPYADDLNEYRNYQILFYKVVANILYIKLIHSNVNTEPSKTKIQEMSATIMTYLTPTK